MFEFLAILFLKFEELALMDVGNPRKMFATRSCVPALET
jgi:hypothetical protein